MKCDSTCWPLFVRRGSASAASRPFGAEPVSPDRRVTVWLTPASLPLVAFLRDCAHSLHVSSERCFSHKTTFGLATRRHVHSEQDHTRTVTEASAWAPPSMLRRPKIQVVNSPNVMYFPCLSFAGLMEVLRRRTVRKAINQCR